MNYYCFSITNIVSKIQFLTMFNALKKLTTANKQQPEQNANINNMSGNIVQMSGQLQRKFAKGVQFNSK